MRYEALPSHLRTLQAVVWQTTPPWACATVSLVRVCFNLSSCRGMSWKTVQRGTFVQFPLLCTGNLSNWHRTSVCWGYFYRKARDISIHKGDYGACELCSSTLNHVTCYLVTQYTQGLFDFFLTILTKIPYLTVTTCLLNLVAKRLQCVKNIPSGQRSHQGAHIHSLEKKLFHFCESRYDLQYFSIRLNSIDQDASTAIIIALCHLVRNWLLRRLQQG